MRALLAAGLRMHNSRYAHLRVANKNTTSIEGEFYVPFNVEGIVRVVTVLYVPLLSCPLILGLDFWRRYHLLPDFVNNTVEIAEVQLLDKPPEVNEECLNASQKAELQELLEEFRPLLEPGKLGCVKGYEHVIDTGASPPVQSRYNYLNPRIMGDVHIELDDRLKRDIVEPSASPWQSPLLILPKKDKGFRWVVDLRKVNEVVINPNQYPLPRINPTLASMKGAAIISTIDIKDAYLQIALAQESKEKTAFYVPGRGKYHYKRLPAGLKDASSTWQRLLEKILTNEFKELDVHIVVYMDDILIYSPEGQWEHHREKLRKVFQRLAEAGITINLEKCKFAVKSVKYLGHIIDEFGVRPDPGKVAAVMNYPRPKTVTQVRQFVGLAGWMRKFIPNFSSISRPLYAKYKLPKGSPLIWTEEDESAFVNLKGLLSKGPVLRSPDFSKPFMVYCDGSSKGTGAILTQMSADGEHAVAYTSRVLKGRERIYSATELECLAVLHALETFRPYLEGYKFDLYTDHSSLKWLHKLKNPNGRLARWAVQIQQYDMNVIHRKGSAMQAPDALSRNPVEVTSALVDIPEAVEDNWYLKMVKNVEEKPESFEKFCLKDGVLFKLITVKSTLPLQWVQVIPRETRRAVLQECHDNPTSGHGGWKRTFQRLRTRGYWPNMRKEVQSYVERCQTCQKNKVDRRRKPGLMGSGDIVTQPFECVSVDLIGPLPRSKKGNTFISVVTDAFSKYVCVRPLTTATAANVCKHFKEEVILRHGAPRLVLADNGKQYAGHEFKNLCGEFNSKIRFNNPYVPRSNPTERQNQTLETVICCFVSEDHREWDILLPEIQSSMNTSESAATGYSPHQAIFGETLILDGRERVYKGDEEAEVVVRDMNDEDYKNLQEARARRFLDIMSRLKEAQRRNAKRWNLRRRPDCFAPGDIVWRRQYIKSDKAQFVSKKLAEKYTGPFTVKAKIGRVSYLLEDEKGKDDGPWHIDQLKKNIR